MHGNWEALVGHKQVMRRQTQTLSAEEIHYATLYVGDHSGELRVLLVLQYGIWFTQFHVMKITT